MDAPNVYVSVFLVKGADLSSRKVQNPQLKLGYAALKVQSADNMLNVEMKVPAGMSLPAPSPQSAAWSRTTAGKPVRNADVCLFAEDEGTLQVIGLPDAAAHPVFLCGPSLVSGYLDDAGANSG